VLTTVLGSCVSVCAWSGLGPLGAMSHTSLPGDLAPALERLLALLRQAGAPAHGVVAKLLGGAGTPGSVGEANARTARALLSQRRLPVVAEDLGGARGRRLRFDVRTGVVRVEYLGPRSPGGRP
jgi:chemotaxis protein CheD